MRDTLPRLSDARLRLWIDAVTEVKRRLGSSTPPPRGRPFFALDDVSSAPAPTVGQLASAGTVRKYTRVLQIGCGLGSVARWLALQMGCEVVGVDWVAPVLGGAASLTRRAGLAEQIVFVTATPTALPFPSATFTHAWTIDVSHRGLDLAAYGREIFRIVRPGGYWAIHDTSDVAAVRGAGFRILEERPVADPPPPPAVVELARQRLADLLRPHDLDLDLARRILGPRATGDPSPAPTQLVAFRPG